MIVKKTGISRLYCATVSGQELTWYAGQKTDWFRRAAVSKRCAQSLLLLTDEELDRRIDFLLKKARKLKNSTYTEIEESHR